MFHRTCLTFFTAALSIAAFWGDIASAAVYLRADSPGGTDGQTFDGMSWSTAYKSIGDALVALNADESGDPTLYIAKGIYSTGSMTVHALTRDATMLGGYKGETDGDMTRDSEEYQSIISGISSPETKTWTRCIPVPGGFTYKTESTTEKIVVDGKLNLPAPTGEFDAYVTSSSGSYFLRVNAGCAIVADGIKFICFNREGTPGGSAIGVNNNAKQAEISNCVFAGGDGLQRSMLWIGTTTEESSVKNCKFYYNRANYSNNPHAIFSGTVTIEDCEFVGAVRGGGAPTDGAINGGKLVKNCLFSHNMTPSSVSASGCPLISLGSGTLEGCKIVNNFCADKAANAYYNGALIRLSTGTVKDCLIANNRCEFYVLDGKGYSMLGRYSDTSQGPYSSCYTNCVIASNVVAATSIGMTSGSYAISVMGSGSTARNFTDKINNCVLDGNIVSNVVVEGVTPTLCRGVLGFRLGATQTMTVYNCTFAGPDVPGVYDFATYGDASTTAKSYVYNSIFMRDGDGADTDAIHVSQANSIVLKDCTIKNMLPDFHPSDVDVTDGLYFDEIPFERVPYLFNGEDTGYGWLRPAAKTPGIRVTTDGSVRGAVNELTETAENGVTLTIRREPFVGGTVDIPVQAVTAGAGISPVTATPVAGGSFGGWINVADGTTYSTDNPLTIASLDDDLILTASFATRKTTITFDLSGAGTFVENGASRIERELSAGDTFPELPEHTVGDNNHIYRWDDMPTVVPNEDVTYAAHWVTKDLRIIYVTKEGAGAKDGTSWENAYDDISAAYADAGHYRGEVWIGEGVYTQALPTVKCASVNVRGGFAGDETSAAEADPAAHPTVISGGRTTFYFLTDTDGVAGDAEITGLLFTDFYRSAIDFSTADVGKVTVSKCRFENCNLGGSTSYAGAWVLGEPTFSDCFFSNCVRAIYAKSTIAATTVVERCMFVANRDAGVHVAAANDGRMVVRNCEFRDGVMTTANAYSSGCQLEVKEKRASATISDCTFARNQNRDQARGCVGFYGSGNAGDFIVERCAFRDNVCQHSSWNNTDGYFTSQQFGTCVSLEAQGTTTLVRDCSFVGNVVTNFGGCGASCIVSRSSASKAVAVNCTFEANVAIARENLDRSGTWRSVGNAGTINAAASGIGLVNCTFVANTNRADTGGVVADIFARASTPCFVLNDILWNDNPDYAPFARTDSGALTVGRTVAKSYDETVPSAEMGSVLMEDPRLSAQSKEGPNGVPAYAISGSSCAARGGYPVWTSGAQLYVYDSDRDEDAKWLNVSTRAWVAEDKLPPDVSKAAPLAPDAWGQRRGFRRVAFGALNAPSPATFILVR